MLHAKIPYVSTPQEKSDSWRSLVALDCEMVSHVGEEMHKY